MSGDVQQGRRVLKTMMYQPDSYPLGAICVVDIMSCCGEKEQAKFWLWYHVTDEDAVSNLLKSIFAREYIRCSEIGFRTAKE